MENKYFMCSLSVDVEFSHFMEMKLIFNGKAEAMFR